LADDSVIKPFESQELISKINAALTMVSAEAEQAVLSERRGAQAVAEADILQNLRFGAEEAKISGRRT
jgi:DNA-binding response OmpR family regulator